MYKFKRRNSRNGENLILTSQKGQQLSTRECQMLRDGEVAGFLYANAEGKGSGIRIFYPISGLVSLQDFLRSVPLRKEDFSSMLREILRILESAESAHLITQRIVYNVELVMVDPSTFHIFFIYIPLQPCEEQGTLRGLLYEIVNNSFFLDVQEDDYVGRLMMLLQRGPNLSMFELEEYVHSLFWQAEKDTEKITCPQCNGAVDPEDVFCGLCGYRLKQPQKKPENAGVYIPQVGNTLGALPEKRLETDDKSIEDDEGVSTVVPEDGTLDHQQAYLLRVKTGERIPISQKVFSLGRMGGQCHYRIGDNASVSRHHADIVRSGELYFVRDCHSSNGTFVNGQRLVDEMMAQLTSGSKLNISTEEFIFYD